MLIVGAKGFAKEVLEVLIKNNVHKEIVFYDDVSSDFPDLMFNQFKIIKNLSEAKDYFMKISNKFCLGVGNPEIREMLCNKFQNIGGVLTSTISNNADLGSLDVYIGHGTNILDGVKISNSVHIGKAALIYYNVIITHDCTIGDFVEISPNATILGRVNIGNYVHIGASATILPDIKIGNHVTIGAGAVVTKDVPDYAIVAGVPARILKYKINE